MAFDLDRWSRQSVAMNTGALTVDGSLENGPAIFTYSSATDTIATIEADDYFASVVYDLAVGDLLLVNSSEGYVSIAVSAVDRDAGTISTVSAPLSGLNPVETVTVSLTSVQVLALRATPIQLVAGGGADRVVQFLGAELVLDYNSAQYTEAGDNLAIRYENATGAIVSENIETTGFIDQAADTLTNAIPKKDVIVAATGAVNQALMLHNIGAAEFLVGDSPLELIVSYKVVSANLA